MIPIPASLREGLLWQLLRCCLVLLVLLGAALLAGALLVISRDPPPAMPPAPGTLTAVPLAVPESPARGLAGEMLARPLFWSSRRPVVEVAVAEEGPAPVSGADTLDGARLLGILASGKRTGVILALGEQRRRLMQGEDLEGWVLESLDGNRAVFVREDGAGQPVFLTLEHAQVRQREDAPEPQNKQGDT